MRKLRTGRGPVLFCKRVSCRAIAICKDLKGEQASALQDLKPAVRRISPRSDFTHRRWISSACRADLVADCPQEQSAMLPLRWKPDAESNKSARGFPV